MAKRDESGQTNEEDVSRRDRAVKRYVQLGEELYGVSGVEPEGVPWDKRAVRRQLRFVRRELEHRYPDIRQLEKDTYRTGAMQRRVYIPKLYVTFILGDTGELTYPDGSREQSAVHYFANRAELKRILAQLLYYGRIGLEDTEIVTARSALPLSTFIVGLV